MRISSYILFFTFILGFLPLNNIADNSNKVLNVEQFTIEDGLSQTSVNCLLQDARGFIWVGTQDGLNKFDGYIFEVFKFNRPGYEQRLSYN